MRKGCYKTSIFVMAFHVGNGLFDYTLVPRHHHVVKNAVTLPDGKDPDLS